jgi:hypothetical protein
VAQRLRDQLGQVVDVQVVQERRLARAQRHPGARVARARTLTVLWETAKLCMGRVRQQQQGCCRVASGMQ